MLFLTRNELIELTGYKRSGAQLRALRQMGIEHRIRPDGAILVLRSHIESLLGGHKPTTASEEPDWSALDDAAA